MSITNSIKRICTGLGKNNKSTYSVVAIAVSNGIFRPTFTMLKKDADPASKKYAATREALTEMIAIPSYLICGELAAKCGEKLAKASAKKELLAMEKQGKIMTDKAKKIFTETKVHDAKASLMLIGVCAAAGLVIPALCSAIMNPIMAKMKKTKKQEVLVSKDLAEPLNNVSIQKTTFKARKINNPIYNVRIGNMKVGGL